MAVPHGDGATAPAVPPLNGQLLGSYDVHRAESDRVGAVGRYVATVGAPHLELQADDLAPEPEAPGGEMVLDENNLLPFSFLRTGDRLGRAVVKLLRADGAAGTGFLVAPGVLLTNHHVLPTPEVAAATRVFANFEAAPPADAAGRAAVVQPDPTALFVTNAELDFTFCGITGLEHLGVVPLDRDSLRVMPAESVNIIQHPRGRPKEVALHDNRVVKVDNVVVQYCCDTEPGSSGSPVFNNAWHLVALHHASVVVNEEEGGRCACGTDPQVRFLNEGIRMSAIAVWLETVEADEQFGRERAARLRALFQGFDPQIGFFGALGRRTPGKTGAEAVVECYHGRSGCLDLAFWNLAPLRSGLAERLDVFGRFLATSGIDAWCLAHCDPELLGALLEHLRAGYRIDVDGFSGPPGEPVPMGVLVRRGPSLAHEWLGGDDRPVRLLLRPGPVRRRWHSIQVIPLARGPESGLSRARVEAILREAADPSGSGLLLIGDGLCLRSFEALTAAHADFRAAFGADGGLALLGDPRSALGPIYVGPNLDLTIGDSHGLIVATDRRWPDFPDLSGRSRPVAVRLTFAAASSLRRRGGDRPHGSTPLLRTPEVPGLSVTEAVEFERMLRQFLAHIEAGGGRVGSEPGMVAATRDA